MAYATGRTLILNPTDGEEYTHWWIKNFLPLSQKCSINDIQSNIHSDCKLSLKNIYSSSVILPFFIYLKNYASVMWCDNIHFV